MTTVSKLQAAQSDAGASAAGMPPALAVLVRELERIDKLIALQVEKARNAAKVKDEFRGLLISEQEVDELLARSTLSPQMTDPAPEAAHIHGRLTVMSHHPRLAALAQWTRLSSFEIDCLLVCLAPELDNRYERLYAYLQDDVTKRRPNVDLVLSLLCPTFGAKMQGRLRFLHKAPLLKHGLLQLFEDPSQPYPTLLGKYLRVDERIVNYLLGSDEPDSRLLLYASPFKPELGFEDLVMPRGQKSQLSSIARERAAGGIILYLQGPAGSGRRTIAGAIAQDLERSLLIVDGARLASLDICEFENLAELAVRESILQKACLYWSGFDTLASDEKGIYRRALMKYLDVPGQVMFLSGEKEWNATQDVQSLPFVRIEIERPAYTERAELWTRMLDCGTDADPLRLANQFRFTPGQIRDAAETARHLAAWRNPHHPVPAVHDLHDACRLQCNQRLSSLARKIKPLYTWDDIILPGDRLRQLREICNSVRYRSIVYEEWGFDRKLSIGKGLNVLFAGPPGTGKTMAAEILGAELSLELYKIDLSTVVSKFIGETEKNLSRIFDEAEASNAILFFDEADALFGKRSEVRDSHDRYANIEVGYLLQRMEEYQGVVVLATNFRKNMDEAFVRRLHFALEFPFPSEADRKRIWETIWPKDIPIDKKIDTDFLACKFEIAGGNIRNVALGAAFLAAANGGMVTMAHLIHAVRREYQKMGKVVTDGDFE